MGKAYALFLFAVSLLNFSNAIASTIYHVDRPDGSAITVYVTAPQTTGQYAATLIVEGSGCGSSYTNATKPIIFPNGKPTARLDVEKYGIDKDTDTKTCPKEFLEHNTVNERLQDHLIVMNWLRQQPWWNKELYIIGGSEGGIEAASLSVLIPETKAAGLMSSPLGTTMAQSWLKVNERALQKEGKGSREIQQALQAMQNQFQMMRDNPTWEKSWQGAENTYKWWADILDYKTSKLLLQTKIPIIFIQGDNDQESDIDSARALVTEFASAGKTNLTYIERPGEDHTFNDQQGKSHLGEVVTAILIFFTQN